MGPLQRLTKSWFKVDRLGITVYFPFGVLGSGYEVSDASLPAKVHRLLWAQLVALCACLALFVFFGALPAVIGALATSLGATCYNLSLVRGLARSSERLTFVEYWAPHAVLGAVAYALLATGAAGAIAVLSLALWFGAGDNKRLFILGIVLASTAAVWSVWMFRLLWAYLRQQSRGGT